MRFGIRRFLLACSAVLALGACSDRHDDASTGTASAPSVYQLPTPPGAHAVGLALSNGRNPFFMALKLGVETGARDSGIHLFVEDAGDDAVRQAHQVRALIDRKIDVLLLNPADSQRAAPLVQAAARAGIPVVTLDRSVTGARVAAHIASDNLAGGRMAGEYIKERLHGRGQVVELLGVPGASASIERDQGFSLVLRAARGLKLAAREEAGFDRVRARAVMSDILRRQPAIDAVFALNDEMALGALDALHAAGRQHVLVVGFDATAAGLAAIRAGTMAATVAQRPDLIGHEGMRAARRLIMHAPVERFIPVPIELIKP